MEDDWGRDDMYIRSEIPTAKSVGRNFRSALTPRLVSPTQDDPRKLAIGAEQLSKIDTFLTIEPEKDATQAMVPEVGLRYLFCGDEYDDCDQLEDQQRWERQMVAKKMKQQEGAFIDVSPCGALSDSFAKSYQTPGR